MNIWLLFGLMALGTYAMRLSFILLFGRVEFPESFRRGLPFVPPTVFAAIILPSILKMEGEFVVWGNARFFAAMAAGLVAYKTKNVVLTIVVGMVVLYLLEWVGY